MKAIFAIVFAAFVASVYGAGEVKCPPVNGVDVTILPNPDDCKTFYICNEGIPFLMNCPPGQEFNAELRVCDLPEQAHCVPSGHKPSTTTPSPISTTTGTTLPNPISTPAGTTPPNQNCFS